MSVQNNIIESSPNTCFSCMGKLIFDLEKNEKICSNCGIVTDHDFDNHSGYDLEHSSSSEPTSSMMYDISLSTMIDKKNVDSSGKQIYSGFEMEKLRRLNKFTISNDAKTRNLNKAMADIRRITGVLGFGNSIAERASYIYRKALNKDLIRGRSITGISVAAIYIACKDVGVSFPIDKINEHVENVSKKTVVHYYKFLLRQMKMSVSIPEPSQNVSKIAARANLGGRTQRRALGILSKVGDDPTLIGKKPISVAAAALYMAALETKEYTTQLRLAVAADLTTITIRKRYLEIMQILKEKLLSVPDQDIQGDSEKLVPCDILQVAQISNHI
ncbi:MAG: transcription initiation factor IIB [Nitrosotalea sp.]